MSTKIRAGGWSRDTYNYLSFPDLTREIKCLYVGMGDEPVGRPRTKGFSGVGPNSLMLRPKVIGK